jgi:hypothetical protein
MAYVNNKGKVESYLFDLNKDPFEMNNIYDPNSEIVKRYRKELIKWLANTKDIFVIPDK